MQIGQDENAYQGGIQKELSARGKVSSSFQQNLIRRPPLKAFPDQNSSRDLGASQQSRDLSPSQSIEGPNGLPRRDSSTRSSIVLRSQPSEAVLLKESMTGGAKVVVSRSIQDEPCKHHPNKRVRREVELSRSLK